MSYLNIEFFDTCLEAFHKGEGRLLASTATFYRSGKLSCWENLVMERSQVYQLSMSYKVSSSIAPVYGVEKLCDSDHCKAW